MVIYRAIKEIEPIRNSILTIGSFDGLHRGHQEIIKKVITTANAVGEKSVVITFDPHPKEILMNHSPKVFELLMDIDKKLALLENLGIDIIFVIHFDLDFSHITAKSFIEEVLIGKFYPKQIIIGYDHHFGFRREGNSEFLQSYAEKGNYTVVVVPEVKDQDKIISSTFIRCLIKEGYVRRASFELGWVYGFDAYIVHGAGRGHKLNFPTANFVPKDERQLIPKSGVYFARGIFNMDVFYGMCNIGYRPTFDEKEFVMEIHFFDDLVRDIYGELIEVQFLERIRDEIKFSSKDELISQLHKDKEYCLSRINIYSKGVK